MLIPRIFHSIWVQGTDDPSWEPYKPWHETWLGLHPEWEHRVWSEADYLPLVEGSPAWDIYQTAVNHAQRTEIAARFVVYEHGGVWIDADFQALKNIEPLIESSSIFCGEETYGGLSAGIWGATPQHPLIWAVIEDMDRSIRWQREKGLSQTYGTGPWILRRLWNDKDEIKRFAPPIFYPYRWDQPDPGQYGEAFAVHHWAATWKQ